MNVCQGRFSEREASLITHELSNGYLGNNAEREVLKILHLTNHLNIGGITTYIRTLAWEQVKAGHDVFVWGSRGTCAEDLRAKGITVFEDVPRCKSELSPRIWLALPKLIHILKAQSIDIVHTHTRVTQVLAAAATFFIKFPYFFHLK